MEERNILHAFITTNRMHKKIVDNFTSDLRLRRGGYILLSMLSSEAAPLSQEEIARRLEISPAAVATKLKRYESLGLISREKTAGDSRVNSVKITEKGSAAKRKTDCTFSHIDKKTLEGISEEEITVFLNVLIKMQKNLDELEQETKGDA